MLKNKIEENKTGIEYNCKVGGEIWIIKQKDEISSKLSEPTEGPHSN